MYYKVTVNTLYCGTEQEEYIKCETIQEAEIFAEALCKENAESYEYLVSGWDNENFEDLTEEEQAEALEDYYADCDWCVDEISEAEYLENV